MTTHARLTPGEALIPLAMMLALIVLGAAFLELTGELLVLILLTATAVAGLVAVRHGASWDDIQRATGVKLAAVLPAVLILLAIGMLIATWVVSGTIPFLVYWGVRLVRPEYLALTAFLATAIMSTFTGTSWGSAGTIGVALVATAAALGAPLGLVAGAVVSGAYLGDKMSPLSDTTILSGMAAGAPLFRHIRHMLYTAVPSFAGCLVLYTLASRLTPFATAGLPATARTLLADIERAYRLHWIVLLPPAVVIWGIVRRMPAALAITLSSVVAAAIGVAFQGFALRDALLAPVSGFRLDMLGEAGPGPTAGSEAFRTLLERGGLEAMAPTLVLIIAAFLLTGAMEASGALDLLISRLLSRSGSVFGLVASTMASGGTLVALTSHAGVTALVVGEMFQPAYRERGLAPENLSRSIEDSVTITEPLMPWTVSGVFMATTLGVATTRYAPWALFCYGGSFTSLLLAGLYQRTRFGLRPLSEARPDSSD